MGKFKTVRITMDGATKLEIDFSCDVYIDKEGLFSTTLPKDIVTKFEERGITFSRNRSNNPGYFCDSTYDSLIKQVKSVCAEYLSRKLTGEKVVIKYIIQTTCAYCISKTDGIVPNGNYLTEEEMKNGYWKEGTISQDARHGHPFGVAVYAEPYVRFDYEYKSGTKKTEYKKLCYGLEDEDEFLKDKPNLQWLDDFVALSEPEGQDTQEIDYDENVAGFFVNLLKSICMINEKIKDKLTPDAIKYIADNNIKLLS